MHIRYSMGLHESRSKSTSGNPALDQRFQSIANEIERIAALTEDEARQKAIDALYSTLHGLDQTIP